MVKYIFIYYKIVKNEYINLNIFDSEIFIITFRSINNI